MWAKVFICFFVILNLILNMYGNNWGLPSRWHSDEKVINVLHMLHEKSLIDTRDYFFYPTGYQFVLSAWLIPYFIFLKFNDYPLESIKEAASISWICMAKKFPDFAINIYIYSRTLSAVLGAITVYLIFLIAKKLYNNKAGLLSAAFLSVCMGFVGINHYAKYPSLVNLFIVLTLLFCIIVLDNKILDKAKKYFYLAVFLAGMATSVKFNALLLLLPLFLTYIFKFLSFSDRRQTIINLKASFAVILFCFLLFILGFLIFTPSFLVHFKDYFNMTKTTLNEFSFGLSYEKPVNSAPFFIRALNYLIELTLIYGVPLFILILAGAVFRMLSFRKISKKEVVVFSFVAAYFFVMTVNLQDMYPKIKYINSIIPLLILFAGKTMSDIFDFKRIGNALKWLIFLAIFSYSLIYTCKADLVFLREDTRYVSTKWINENIPLDSKIEIFSQAHLLFSNEILSNYEVIYLGKSSKEFRDQNLPRWINIEDRNKYIEELNKYDSTADYIVVNVDYLDKVYAGRYLSYLPGLDRYVKSLFENKRNFVLIKIFECKNKKIVLKKFCNLIVPENIFWDPVPDHEAISPTIYIFKRINAAKRID